VTFVDDPIQVQFEHATRAAQFVNRLAGARKMLDNDHGRGRRRVRPPAQPWPIGIQHLHHPAVPTRDAAPERQRLTPCEPRQQLFVQPERADADFGQRCGGPRSPGTGAPTNSRRVHGASRGRASAAGSAPAAATAAASACVHAGESAAASPTKRATPATATASAPKSQPGSNGAGTMSSVSEAPGVQALLAHNLQLRVLRR
jgi:hypothetical protein